MLLGMRSRRGKDDQYLFSRSDDMAGFHRMSYGYDGSKCTPCLPSAAPDASCAVDPPVQAHLRAFRQSRA